MSLTNSLISITSKVTQDINNTDKNCIKSSNGKNSLNSKKNRRSDLLSNDYISSKFVKRKKHLITGKREFSMNRFKKTSNSCQSLKQKKSMFDNFDKLLYFQRRNSCSLTKIPNTPLSPLSSQKSDVGNHSY